MTHSMTYHACNFITPRKRLEIRAMMHIRSRRRKGDRDKKTNICGKRNTTSLSLSYEKSSFASSGVTFEPRLFFLRDSMDSGPTTQQPLLLRFALFPLHVALSALFPVGRIASRAYPVRTRFYGSRHTRLVV